MPICCATRRIESASMPASSRSSGAALTIFAGAGVSWSGALVAIVSPKSVAERAVQRDVKQPRQGADQQEVRDQSEDGESGQSERSPAAMNEVIDRHRPGMQLSLREVTTAAVEQREVRANSENDDLPVARVGDRVGGDPDLRLFHHGAVGSVT